MAGPLDSLLSSSILPGDDPLNDLKLPSKTSPLQDYIPVPGAKGKNVTLGASDSADVLAKMQAFLDERNSPYHKIMSNLEYARASAVPNVGGEASKALNELSTRRDSEAKTAQEMQMQIAEFKANQARTEALRKDLTGAYDAAHPKGNITGDVVGVPSTGAVKSDPSAMPEPMWQDYQIALRNGDSAGAQKIKNDWDKYAAEQGLKTGKEFKFSAAGQKQEAYTVKTPNGTIQLDLTPVQWEAIQAAGTLPDGTPVLAAGPSGGVAPSVQAPNVAAPVAGGIQPSHIAKIESNNTPFAVGPNVPGQGQAKSAMQVMGATSNDPGFGVKPAQLTGDKVHDEAERVRVGTDYFNALKTNYNNDTLAAIAYNWGPGNTDKWLAEGADIKKLPKETRDYVSNAHITSATSDRGPAAPAAAAPAAASMGANEQRVQALWEAKGGPKNKSEFDKQKDEVKAARDADVKLASTITQETVKSNLAENTKGREAAAKAMDAMQHLSERAPHTIADADLIINHASQHPEEFGWQYGTAGAIPGGILSAAEAVHPSLEKGIENAMQLYKPNKDETGKTKAERRVLTDQAAARVGLDFASQMFAGTGARLGLGLEKMASEAKGVSTKFPASTNILNAKLVKAASEKAQDLAPLWQTYKNSMPTGSATYYDFLQSGPAKAVEAKWDPKFAAWANETKQKDPEYYNQLVKASKPDIKSFFKKKQD